MKKLTLFLISFIFLWFLSGCSNTQEISVLQEQNRLLQQQIEQKNQELEEATTKTYSETTPTKTSTNTTYSEEQYKPTATQVESTPVVEEKPTYTPPIYESTQTSCCKICSKGKACWDSCISRSYTCHKWPGCACDG